MADDAEETVTYQFDTDADVWDRWVETIPRKQPIHSRLSTLIEQDLRSATRDGDGEQVEGKTLGIFATRIRIRGMHALSYLRDDEDEAAAVEQIEEIIDMADLLEG